MMGFAHAIRTCFSKYATFSGRAGPAEFWWFALFLLLGATIAGTLDTTLFGGAGLAPVTSLFQLATLLPITAVGFRRMHDTGRPGWFIFLPLIVSLTFIYLSVMGFASGPNPDFSSDAGGSRFVILGVLQLIALALIVWWLTRPSQPGPNAYGPNPHEVTP